MAEFSIELEGASGVSDMLSQFGDRLLRYTVPASRVTADKLVVEMQRRVARGATNETAEGIQSEPLRNGDGYYVTASNRRMPNLPLWIEAGTKKGKPRSHDQAARPFFWASVRVEESAHERRISEAIDKCLRSEGLG